MPELGEGDEKKAPPEILEDTLDIFTPKMLPIDKSKSVHAEPEFQPQSDEIQQAVENAKKEVLEKVKAQGKVSILYDDPNSEFRYKGPLHISIKAEGDELDIQRTVDLARDTDGFPSYSKGQRIRTVGTNITSQFRAALDNDPQPITAMAEPAKYLTDLSKAIDLAGNKDNVQLKFNGRNPGLAAY